MLVGWQEIAACSFFNNRQSAQYLIVVAQYLIIAHCCCSCVLLATGSRTNRIIKTKSHALHNPLRWNGEWRKVRSRQLDEKLFVKSINQMHFISITYSHTLNSTIYFHLFSYMRVLWNYFASAQRALIALHSLLERSNTCITKSSHSSHTHLPHVVLPSFFLLKFIHVSN